MQFNIIFLLPCHEIVYQLQPLTFINWNHCRKGSRFGHDTLIDGMLKDGLWDVYNNFPMGMCAELCANQYSFSREEQVY